MNKAKVAILLWVGSAIGALWWMMFASDLRVFQRAMSQDGRDAIAVAAVPLPSKSIEVKIVRRDSSCVHVERAMVDSDTWRVYVVRTCGGRSYWEIHVKQKAPDGTVIGSWWTNQLPNLSTGERAEIKPPTYLDTWSIDPRTVVVEVYASGNE